MFHSMPVQSILRFNENEMNVWIADKKNKE